MNSLVNCFNSCYASAERHGALIEFGAANLRGMLQHRVGTEEVAYPANMTVAPTLLGHVVMLRPIGPSKEVGLRIGDNIFLSEYFKIATKEAQVFLSSAEVGPGGFMRPDDLDKIQVLAVDLAAYDFVPYLPQAGCSRRSSATGGVVSWPR